MNKYKIFLLHFLILFSLGVNHASPWKNYKMILRLGNNDGLSNSSINDLFQDSDGRMWIATWDGLNSYNGKQVETFRPDAGNPTSISYHVVRTITEDKEGYLWIATDFGLNRMNRSNKTFVPYYFGYPQRGMLRENSFICTIDTFGGVWAGIFKSGLYHYNHQTKEFDKIEVWGVNSHQITQLVADVQNHLWLSTGNEELTIITLNDSGSYSSSEKIKLSSPVRKLLFDGKNHVWGQLQNGEYIWINSQTKSIEPLPIHIKSEFTFQDIVYSNQCYYIATSGGLFIYSHGLGTIAHEFSHLSLFSLLFGNDKILWLGSDSQGVFRVINQQKPFYSLTGEDVLGLKNHPVRAIQVIDKNIYLGTKGGGLLQIPAKEKENDNIIEKHFSQTHGLLNTSILSLANDLGKGIFIGTDGVGLFYRQLESEKILTLDKSPELKSIYALLPQSDSVLWVGTSGNGLFHITLRRDRKSQIPFIQKIKRYTYQSQNKAGINNNIIYSLCIESDSLLWIATRGGGLNCLNLHTHQFTAYLHSNIDPQSLSNNDVIALLLSENKTLWIGTGGGLNQRIMNKNNEYEFVRFTEQNGIPNATIHALQEDMNHRIWASTNKGLFRLNPQTQEFNFYDYQDGLQSNEFSDGASFSLHQGKRLFFGGINGITLFYPEAIETQKELPRFQLDEILVNNQPLQTSIALNQHYTFNHQSQYLSFRFSIFDYISNPKCKISYKLSGGVSLTPKSNEWIDLSSREIILSNLSSGDYTLKIRYSNSDNIWSVAPIIITFTILSPWWLTPFAIIGYILLSLGITYWIILSLRNRLKLAHRLQLETFEKKKLEDIHQAKLRFFTNIAHEFSNSITLIYGPSERLLAEDGLNDKTRSYLSVIRNSARRMQSLIQQLMEFRKAETGHLALHYERVDVPELIRYTADNFLDQIAQKGIVFTVENKCKNIDFWISDRDALEKIIFNLLSNACKYTEENGHISITITIDSSGELVLTCKNSGEGIAPENIKLIFNRFKVLDSIANPFSKNNLPRNGIGLALCQSLTTLLKGSITAESEEGKFTVFIVRLPSLDESLLQSSTSIQKNLTTPGRNLPAYSSFQQEGRKIKVLIVDDDADIRFFIHETLSTQFEVIEAQNGEEALEQVKTRRPQIIVTDILMPLLNGIELVKQLKNNATTKHIPIIILSSKVSIEDQLQGLSVGAVNYLNKPFHPDLLIASINSLIGSVASTLEYSTSPQSNKIMYGEKELDKEDYDFISQTLAILSRNLDNDEYNQDMLARELSITKVQFYRRIKRITGRTPSDFIRHYRFTQVERLLVTTTRTIQEIMYDCGFRNKAYFFREFAKIYNVTPKEYRQSHRKQQKPL